MFNIETIATLGLAGLGAVLFVETGLFVGVVFPGDSLLFSFGILASIGKVSLWGSIIVSIVASYMGYDLTYRLGRTYGEKIFSRKSSTVFSSENLERSKKYFEKFGIMTIFFARFIPVVRSIAGAMAGASGMNKKKFVVWNLLGAIFWPASLVLLGYYFGSIIPNPDRFILPIIIIVMVLSFLVPIIVRYFKKKPYV